MNKTFDEYMQGTSKFEQYNDIIGLKIDELRDDKEWLKDDPDDIEMKRLVASMEAEIQADLIALMLNTYKPGTELWVTASSIKNRVEANMDDKTPQKLTVLNVGIKSDECVANIYATVEHSDKDGKKSVFEIYPEDYNIVYESADDVLIALGLSNNKKHFPQYDKKVNFKSRKRIIDEGINDSYGEIEMYKKDIKEMDDSEFSKNLLHWEKMQLDALLTFKLLTLYKNEKTFWTTPSDIDADVEAHMDWTEPQKLTMLDIILDTENEVEEEFLGYVPCILMKHVDLNGEESIIEVYPQDSSWIYETKKEAEENMYE